MLFRLCIFLNLLPGLGVVAAAGSADDLPVVWEVTEGLKAPESVTYDRDSGNLFVSQIGGGGGARKDGDGWIVKLSPRGKVVKNRWVTGLDAPKGLQSHDGTLWVSDIDQIVAIDIKKGTIVQQIVCRDARFLNDVACGPDGSVYVADTLGSKIYRYRDGHLSVFAEGRELESPNGLVVDGERLVVAGWGFTTDFSTSTPGRLFWLHLKTRKKHLISRQPLGNLDGVATDGQGGYLVTDWVAGKVLHVTADGTSSVLYQLAQGLADLAFLPEANLLILPQMNENKLTAVEMKLSRK